MTQGIFLKWYGISGPTSSPGLRRLLLKVSGQLRGLRIGQVAAEHLWAASASEGLPKPARTIFCRFRKEQAALKKGLSEGSTKNMTQCLVP